MNKGSNGTESHEGQNPIGVPLMNLLSGKKYAIEKHVLLSDYQTTEKLD